MSEPYATVERDGKRTTYSLHYPFSQQPERHFPMSYSLSITAATKALAKAAVLAEFDAKVVAQQPVHAADRDAVAAASAGIVDVLADDDAQDVRVSINGYVSWKHDPANPDAPKVFTSASVTVSASLVERKTEATPA